MKDRPAPVSVEAARTLRTTDTPAEQQLWRSLRDRNLGRFKFRRQHPWHQFVLDFYCAEAKLVIELDGATHLPEAQQVRDRDRTRVLETRGLRILRFGNQEVLENPDGVLARIAEALTAAPHCRPSLSPSPEIREREQRVAASPAELT